MRYLIGLILFLSTLTAQVTDKNFKDEIGDGFAVVVFTSNYQAKDLDDSILKGINGYEDAQIMTVKSADLKKVVKKLRIRNYPSVVLFHDGKKKEVWKADMDGEVDCSAKDIKDAISGVQSGDVF
jgi:NTP pyrophosphatase (non-canonical NTP hydrolase)